MGDANRLRVVSLLSVIVCHAACAGVAPVSSGDAPDLQPAPYGTQLDLRTGAGEPAPLGELRGSLVLLVVSRPGCRPCEVLTPKVVTLARQLTDDGHAVISRRVWLERPAYVEGEAKAYWAGPRLSNGETRLGEVDRIPVTWLLSREGVPLFRYEGGGDAVLRQIEEDLRGYLRVERHI